MGASVEYCDIHDCHYEVDSAGGLNQCGYCYENNNQTKLNNMIGSTIKDVSFSHYDHDNGSGNVNILTLKYIKNGVECEIKINNSFFNYEIMEIS